MICVKIFASPIFLKTFCEQLGRLSPEIAKQLFFSRTVTILDFLFTLEFCEQIQAKEAHYSTIEFEARKARGESLTFIEQEKVKP